MAKLKEVSPEILKLVQEISTEIGLSDVVNFLTFNVEKQKEVVKLQKANNVIQNLSEKEVIIYIYEDAFDRVDDKTKYFWLRMAMDNVYYDFEKEKVSITGPTITMPLGFYQKHGNECAKQAELALLTIQQIEEEKKQQEIENKAMKKSKKRKKTF